MPAPLLLSTPLAAVRGIGAKRAPALAAAGLETVEDLLLHLPARYEDRSRFAPVAEAAAGDVATFRGQLRDLKLSRPRRGLTLVRGKLADDSGTLAVAWFNRPYLAHQALAGETYVLAGAVRQGRSGLELLNPSCERATAELLHGGRVLPVYPQAGGVGPALLRRFAAAVLAGLELPEAVEEPLPQELLARHGLPPLGEAFLALHAPPEGEAEEVAGLNRRRSPGHCRLLYGELLELCLEVGAARALAQGEPRVHGYKLEGVAEARPDWLPFPLTGAQSRAFAEVVGDLGAPYPMLRLLQGDVGSGKTAVAALALALAADNGLQGALMVPTEILAEQHFASLSRLFAGRYRLALVTARTARDPSLFRALAGGYVQIAVGTHALLTRRVAFQRLGLAVVDEQHRFGVLQRALLTAKGERPDLLVMTATPIPRTLARVAWGDLPVSVLDELPPGRAAIETEVVPARQRGRVYRQLLADLEADPEARAFVVFPRIGDSEGAEGKEGERSETSIAELGERVRRFLAPLPAAVLHGRMPPAEAVAALADFAAGRVRVLLATTAVEVGVDVPEATWMVIEGAERFGLAQLHQLRGRIGRGGRPGRCAALHGELTQEGESRLQVFAATTDGFRIAEADLEIRGPGDLPGLRQAGLPDLRVADLVQDRDWLDKAAADARELLPRLGEEGLAALRERLERRREGLERMGQVD